MIFEELKDIQRRHGWLPAEELESLSKRLDVPMYRIWTVASFYPHFHVTPPAKVDARVCCDMSCHLNGADALKADLERRFKGTSDKDVTFRDVSCLGRCDGAPAVSINDHIYDRVNAPMVEAMIRETLLGAKLPRPPHDSSRPQVQSDPYAGGQPRYGVVRKLLQTRDFAGMIAAIKGAELKGMGGAFFPTAIKWEAVRNAPGDEKYVVCNADESEPGTIKDRFILRHIPHMVVEGMILCGLFTGAKKGIIYIRHEYEEQEHACKEEIERAYREGVLGKSVLGSELVFDMEVFVSPGGYICGEETALIEAIEGKRSEPRNKPPFPVTHGLWNKPTALNNVETFSNVPLILAKGVEWFKAQGRGGAFGLKFVGVSGHVRNPGVFEVPMGTPASEVIVGKAGGAREGRTLKAWAPSGPSSGYLPASTMDARLSKQGMEAIKSILGSGAIVVCDDTTCMLDMALNAVRFYRNESCGKCVPCRVGSQKLVDILTGWTRGEGTQADLPLLDELAAGMMTASICGLGQVAPVPITTVLANFREEVEDHILRKRCPAQVCFRT